MRISDEAIYQALYVQGRGAPQPELVTCLRTGRTMPVTRAGTVEGNAGSGHWEVDLIIDLSKSAIGPLVERTTRFTMLLHLPRGEAYGAR